MQKTFTILKPDTVASNRAGEVISAIQQAGFRIRAMKMLHLTEAQAQGFYHVHKERPFFNGLVQFMTSGPAVVMAGPVHLTFRSMTAALSSVRPHLSSVCQTTSRPV